MNPFRPIALVLLAPLASLVAGAALARAPRLPAQGLGPEHRQFDFWVGDWDVVSPDDGRALGTNSIRLVEEGGALLESWKSASGGTGTSFSFYDPEERLWNQVWVTKTGVLVTVGGLVDGSMVLEDLDASGDLTGRITWTPREDGTVRQHWEKTEDDGNTWSTEFDGIYQRKGEGDR